MDTFLVIIFFILALVMLIWGGNLLVDCAINFSKITGISQIIVGATVVSLLTTLPELLVTIFSSIGGNEGIAVGNAFGSMLFNFLFIVGIVLLFKPLKINLKNYKTKLYLYVIALAFLFVSALSGHLSWIEGGVLFFIFVFFYIQNFLECKKISHKFVPNSTKSKKVLIFDTILLFLLGGIMVGLGARLLVDNSIKLANIIGVSEKIIGFTAVAVGTSIPELTTAIMSIRKNCAHIAIGNVIGANILNATLLLSISVLANGGRLLLNKDIIYLYIPMLILGLLMFVIPVRKYKKTFRLQGAILLFLYLIYLTVLLILS